MVLRCNTQLCRNRNIVSPGDNINMLPRSVMVDEDDPIQRQIGIGVFPLNAKDST